MQKGSSVNDAEKSWLDGAEKSWLDGAEKSWGSVRRAGLRPWWCRRLSLYVSRNKKTVVNKCCTNN